MQAVANFTADRIADMTFDYTSLSGKDCILLALSPGHGPRDPFVQSEPFSVLPADRASTRTPLDLWLLASDTAANIPAPKAAFCVPHKTASHVRTIVGNVIGFLRFGQYGIPSRARHPRPVESVEGPLDGEECEDGRRDHSIGETDKAYGSWIWNLAIAIIQLSNLHVLPVLRACCPSISPFKESAPEPFRSTPISLHRDQDDPIGFVLGAFTADGEVAVTTNQVVKNFTADRIVNMTFNYTSPFGKDCILLAWLPPPVCSRAVFDNIYNNYGYAKRVSNNKSHIYVFLRMASNVPPKPASHAGVITGGVLGFLALGCMVSASIYVLLRRQRSKAGSMPLLRSRDRTTPPLAPFLMKYSSQHDTGAQEHVSAVSRDHLEAEIARMREEIRVLQLGNQIRRMEAGYETLPPPSYSLKFDWDLEFSQQADSRPDGNSKHCILIAWAVYYGFHAERETEAPSEVSGAHLEGENARTEITRGYHGGVGRWIRKHASTSRVPDHKALGMGVHSQATEVLSLHITFKESLPKAFQSTQISLHRDQYDPPEFVLGAFTVDGKVAVTTNQVVKNFTADRIVNMTFNYTSSSGKDCILFAWLYQFHNKWTDHDGYVNVDNNNTAVSQYQSYLQPYHVQSRHVQFHFISFRKYPIEDESHTHRSSSWRQSYAHLNRKLKESAPSRAFWRYLDRKGPPISRPVPPEHSKDQLFARQL
ncbi:hypothetical protein F5146DRAFT_1004987 [Armillaria mellea]|nr:hypothetical protein F5146DRAFT_1004987 [Armillaria mellea]